MSIADTIREDAVDAVRTLHELGNDVVMLTGDNRRTARAIADQVSAHEPISLFFYFHLY